MNVTPSPAVHNHRRKNELSELREPADLVLVIQPHRLEVFLMCTVFFQTRHETFRDGVLAVDAHCGGPHHLRDSVQ